MKRALISPLLLVLAFGFSLFFAAPATQAQKHPDKIKKTKYVTGKLAGFEQGDYIHAIVKPAKGENLSFFIGGPESISFFLAAHQGQQVRITYQEVRSWIEEAGGYTDIERISAVRTTAGLTHTAWWAAERKKSSLKKLRAKYGDLLQKAVVNQ
ncbi:MAG: hypothetical protein ABIP75_06820 [Pyrinomonadaceae bacterium]